MPLAAEAQQAYGSGRGTVLVTPDGDILDYMPEQGSVVIRKDAWGRRVLYDRGGNVVATEMPARGAGRNTASTRSNRGWGMDDAPWDPPSDARANPRNFDDSGYANNNNYNGDNSLNGDNGDLTTGSLNGRYQDGGLVDNQPLPDLQDNNPADTSQQQPLPGNDETASLGPNDQPVTGLPENLESPAPKLKLAGKSSAEIAALQVLLAREGMSPGVIDGKRGSNVDKALHAYQVTSGDTFNPSNSEEVMKRLAATGGLPFVQYTITPADAAGPYVAAIPEDYSQKALLPSMAYTSVTEMLAERFHMDENYLKELNPGVDFTQPGAVVKVVDPGPGKTGSVTRIVANKAIKEVQAFDEQGNLVAVYPASIGSADTPSPSGTHTVARVALNPNYTYNPKINFKQGNNDKVLTIPPGPNGPVGNVWIALDKPTYGIHGTPDPSKIGKTQSHGCVRLTNWDAQQLAKMVKPGTIVQFID